MNKEEMQRKLEAIIHDYKTYDTDRLERMSEDDTRSKFIDRVLKEVLGWEENQLDRQKSIETKDKMKRADYAYPTPIPKIIVEAKKLKAPIEDGDYDQQVLDYAYSKAVNWAALTNFKQFKVWYVTGNKVYPFCNLDLLTGNIEYTLEKLYWLSNDKLLAGQLDEEAQRIGIKIQEINITNDLSVSLNALRSKINKYLNDNYKSTYSENEREELTQGIINRLIFIKKVEAEGLEENKLEQLTRNKETNIYDGLKQIFAFYRDKYDSDIFGKPNQESEAEHITIKDKTITELLDAISHPQNSKREYNFAAIDSDVLGNIYENYLAYIQKGIKLVGGKGTRKSQGIYYTPKNIVEYITKNTLGELLKTTGKSGIEALKVLDPACGSGSFLTAAITLLNDYYSKNYKNYSLLSLKDKLNLIKNNIFGVDLDEKAIAIAELNIYLKLLTQRGQYNIVHPIDLLPELKSNLKVGNSLIDDEKIAKDKAFKWQEEFKTIMENGGFDVVIGNPPYVRVQTTKEDDKNYFISKYRSAEGKFDLYIVFIEKALELLKRNGYFGFIVPNKFTQTKYGKNLKKIITDNFTIVKFIDFGDLKVFGDVTTYPCILIIKKQKPNKDYFGTYVKVKKLTNDISNHIINSQTKTKYEDDVLSVFKFKQSDLGLDLWSFLPEQSQTLYQKIAASSKIKLKDIRERIYEGFITGNNQAFFLSQKEAEKWKIEKEIIQPVPKGKHVRKYCIDWNDEFVIFPYTLDKNNRTILLDINEYPNTKKFLEVNKSELSKRKYLIDAGKKWFEIWNTRNLNWFEQDKIITPNLSAENNFSIDLKDNKSGKYFFIDHDCYGIILKDKKREHYLFLLAILNSKLMEFFIKQKSPMFSGGYYKYHTQYLEQIPIVYGNEKTTQKLVNLVGRIIELNKVKLNSGTKVTSEVGKVESEISKIDREINELVYDLYGITGEEKKIIEDSIT